MKDQPPQPPAEPSTPLERELAAINRSLRDELETYRRLVQTISDVARELGLENVHYDPRTVRRPVLEGDHEVKPPATYDIVCFSIIDWEFRWQRPQQLMSRFAEEGHRVFYVSISRYLPTSGERCAVRELRPNVWEVQLSVPDRLDVYGTEVTRELVVLLLDDLRALRNTFDIVCAVSFVQLATWAPLAYAAREEFSWRIAYDCMDEWDSFPGMSEALLASERRLLRDADLLVVTGRKLLEKYSALNANTVLARNGADFQRFHSFERKPLLEDVPHPIIGYFGAIADWFDVSLLVHAARQRPSYSFVLIGGVFDVDVRELEALPNIHLLGQQPYELMPSYLAAFDVCTIPFKINPITEATDPVKFYEYLSQGKPVVATRMHELEVYSDLLYLADDAADFVRKLDIAVREQDGPLVERRISLAEENTWEARLQAVKGGIVRAHPRASVIIVTYGNLDLTRQCLDSVFAHTLYPNLEVIVVDNGSADGTPAYLRQVEAERRNVRVILNDSNRGFAAANNQGLEVASGDYLVLLNNDTVVPPGWLTRLVRHLRRPDVGLVNAVTNFSGNESRVDVPYAEVSAMPDFARQRGLEYDGEFFDITVAAMYCVAMRREVFERVGPLDEKFGMGMFEDDDYSHRIRIAGFRVVCAEDAFVHHYGQASFKKLSAEEYQSIWDRNQSWYEQKWKTRWRAHVPRKWARREPSLPGRLEVQTFFAKLTREQELQESEKARFLEATHLRDEIAARDMHLDLLKRELFLLQENYEAIVRSRAWKAVQLAWGVLKKLRPARPAPSPPPLSADAFAPSGGVVIRETADQAAQIDVRAGESRSDIPVAPLSDPARYDILCFPIVEWAFRFQRPQQMASELARRGHRVFYVSHRLRPDGPPYEVNQVREGVFELSLRGPARDVFIQSLTPSDVEGLMEVLDHFRLEQNLATTLTIAQLPFWGPLAVRAREAFGWPVVYDCMDLHSAFATAPRQLMEQETELTRKADLVSVSSAELHERVRHQNSNVVLLRNGCDFAHFSSAAERGSPHQREQTRPLIGYYGAVAEWFDVRLVATLARKRPDWDFVIVGSAASADVSSLRRLRNVSLAGERPYMEIPEWLERFDVAIIPFQMTPLTRATNPVKAYEMLAAGKPVVSTGLPEVMAMAPLVRIANTVEEFEKEIGEALIYDYEPDVVARRQSFARENTWAARASALSDAAERVFLPAQVIVQQDGGGEESDYPSLSVTVAGAEDEVGSMIRSDAEVVILARRAEDATARGRIFEAIRKIVVTGQEAMLVGDGDAPWGAVMRADKVPSGAFAEVWTRLSTAPQAPPAVSERVE